MDVTEGEICFVFLIGLILLLSVIFNILVLIVMLRTPKMMNPTNILICNLTVSDIILAGIVIPQNIHDVSHASDDYHEGDFLCRVVNFCPLMCIMASIYSMVAISFERKRAILISTERRPTMVQALRAVPVIWCLSFTFCVPTIIEYSEYREDLGNETYKIRCGSNRVPEYYSILNGACIFFLAYLVPLALLMINYGSILWFFRGRGVFSRNNPSESVITQALYKGRMNVVKMLILVAALFAISWMPYFALFLFEKSTGQSDVSESDGAINMLRIALSVFSTAYNFLLYVAYNRNFRNGFKALFTRRRVFHSHNSILPVVDALEPPRYSNTFTRQLEAREPTTS